MIALALDDGTGTILTAVAEVVVVAAVVVVVVCCLLF
jgi:hypothetical protein